MQQNQCFQVSISSFLIRVASSVLRAQLTVSDPSQDYPYNPFATQREKDDWVLKEMDNLCRGKISLPANIQKQLKCRYVDNGYPFLKLGPFKEEEAYLEPKIVIFHNVIYDGEIEILKELSQPPEVGILIKSFLSSLLCACPSCSKSLRQHLFRDVCQLRGKPPKYTRVIAASLFLQSGNSVIKLVEVKTFEEPLQEGRIGQKAWIQKERHEILEVLLRRTELLTRLSVTSAEPLQVFYYRIGGLYQPHFDFALPDYPEQFPNGNRIATLMYYLNDVEDGGRTVFTRINVSLTPKKGSAVFWYNLTPNGIGEPLTIHAGCPVIAGTKWVANLWLHEMDQEFRRPCTFEKQPEVDWEREDRMF